MLKPAFAALLLLVGSALAAEPRTVTLAVDQMTCAACPITVHKALSHVAGVAQATVDPNGDGSAANLGDLADLAVLRLTLANLDEALGS